MNYSIISKSYFFIFCFLILIAGFLFSSPSAENGPFDFIKNARSALWVNQPLPRGETPTTSKIRFRDMNNDKKGFVRYVNNAVLENGKTYQKSVLHTHPEWKSGGMLIGYYHNVNVPANARFSAKVGFLKDAEATDGVTFQVYVYDMQAGGGERLISHQAEYDGKLDEISADLKNYAGKTVRFELRLLAGPSSSQDWAVWQKADVTAVPVISGVAAGKVMKPGLKSRPQKQQQMVINPGLLQKITMKPFKVRPLDTPPPQHSITSLGPVAVEEPIALSEHIYQDNQKKNQYYFLPREINLIRGKNPGSYKINAVWTSDKKIKTTFFLSADINSFDVKILEEAVREKYGSQAELYPLPYEEAQIIDMEGWNDWEMGDIRIPSFGSLEAEMPINVTMTPESMAELKPLLEQEGLTAGMHIKSDTVEKEIPIKIGLRHFVGSYYSPVDDVNFSFNSQDSTLTIHDIRNYSDFPLKINQVALRFDFGDGEEIYRGLHRDAEVVIPPGKGGAVTFSFAPKPLLLAEMEKITGETTDTPEEKSLLDSAVELLKEKAEEKIKEEAEKRAGIDIPDETTEAETEIDPGVNQFFKKYIKSYWMEVSPDFTCQECLDQIWGQVEVVSYIERMRKINVEVLENVFDPSSYDTPIPVVKVHIEIKSPYLSPQPKAGLMGAVDLTSDQPAVPVTVYLPPSGEPLEFQYKIKAVLETGESAESSGWESVTDSLDLTLGTFHIEQLFQ